MIYALTKLIV